MKIGLSIFERLWLLHNVLPKQGNVSTLRIVRELTDKLGISEEEYTTLAISTTDDGAIKWDMTAEKERGLVELEFGEASKNLLAAQLKKMSEDETLDLGLLDLYDKFVGEE